MGHQTLISRRDRSDAEGMATEIVVGYDESSRGRAALKWASREAVWRHADLVVCHVWNTPYGSAERAAEHIAGRMASVILAEGVLLAQQVLPAHRVGSLLVHGMVGPELVQYSHHAELLVLGTRGLPTPARLRLGSATNYVLPRTHCPVAVVRDSDLPNVHDDRGVVVVTIDSAALDSGALEQAFQEARWRNADLHAWCGDWHDASNDNGTRWLNQIVPAWHERYPDVIVKPMYLDTRPLPSMLVPMDDVELVILGAATGPEALTLLNQTLLSQPTCPVIVIKAP